MKTLTYIILILLSATILPANKLQAKDQTDSTSRARYGIFFGYDMLRQYSNFHQLPGVIITNPTFKNGTGNGITIGGLYELPYKNNFTATLRAKYSQFTSTMNDEETKSVMVDDLLTEALIKHNLETQFQKIGFEFLANVKFYKDWFFFAGIDVNYVMNKTFKQNEELINPAAGNFPNGSRTRFDQNGDIQDGSVYYSGLIFGSGYDIPLDKDETFIIAPEVRYTYGLTPIVPILNWDINFLSAGVSIKYSPLPYQKPDIQFRFREEIDTVKIEVPDLAKSVIITGIPAISYDSADVDDTPIVTQYYYRTDTLMLPKKKIIPDFAVDVFAVNYIDNTETPFAEISIEEFRSENIQPLLTYIFFQPNSDAIPPRYKKLTRRQTNDFEVNDLFNFKKLPTYYQLLNIVGRRMKQYPKSRLAITGCNSGEGTENGNLDLSKRRANSVASYLKDVWNIQPRRLVIRSRNLPRVPTKADSPEGIAENRRVELASNTWEIFAPVVTKDTIIEVTGESFWFKTKIIGKAKIKEWKIDLSQNGEIIKSISGKGEMPGKIHLDINKSNLVSLLDNGELQYVLEAKGGNSKTVKSRTKSINIHRITVNDKQLRKARDKKIYQFSLILFDYNKHSLNSANKRIAGLINDKLANSSKVAIKGYTDRLGDDDYNLKLSEARAKAVRKALDTRLVNSGEVTSEGLGESVLLYDNNLPEGRFYCRTVVVEIETTVE